MRVFEELITWTDMIDQIPDRSLNVQLASRFWRSKFLDEHCVDDNVHLRPLIMCPGT